MFFKRLLLVVGPTMALGFQSATDALAAPDLLARSKRLALPAQGYPELTPINTRVAQLTAQLEANTSQLKVYRKARVRPTDRRYSALTRELNQSRTRLSEIERKLDKAPSLDINRFPAPTGGDRGSSSSDSRARAIAAETSKYDQAKAALRQSLKALSDHYDLLLKEIAKLR